MNYWTATNDELRAHLKNRNAEDFFGEDLPDPDQYDEDAEPEQYRAEREKLEEWAQAVDEKCVNPL